MPEALAGRDLARLAQLEGCPQEDRGGKQANECEDRLPAERSVEQAAKSGASIGAITIAMVTQPIIEAARSRS